MTNVTKEEYWTIILNDPTQIGQITTEDTEFNRRINDVNLVLSNTFINSSDENIISRWESSLYIDDIEGKTITERKADILYTLCEKNYVPVSIIKRFLLNLIGDENRFVVEFIKDENKLVIHTDRISDDMNEALITMVESVVLQNVEVIRYNHNTEISWRDINKYAACTTVDEMKAINSDPKTDMTSDGEWVWPLDNLVNGYLMLQTAKGIKRLKIYAPNCTSGGRMINDVNGGGNSVGHVAEFEVYMPKFNATSSVFCAGSQFRKGTFTFSETITNLNYVFTGNEYLEDFWINDLPNLSNVGNAFNLAVLNKSSILRLLGQLPAYISGTHTGTFGFHVDLKDDEEVLAAIANAESKGWTLTVQWNGTSTSTANTMTIGTLIYAKVGEYELPDGTIEQYLDWGHYVTDETGYETFRSLESAYKYFNLEQPIEI